MRFYALAINLFLVAMFAMASPSRVLATPIKITPIAVTASATAAGYSTNSVTDNSPNTAWNAGRGPSQWIQFDLGRTIALGKIRLQTEQLPNGFTSHKVLVGQTDSNLRQVAAFSQNTVDGQWLEYSFSGSNAGNVRYIRILTDQSPSWVAWKEIEVYQGLEYFGFFRDATQQLGDDNFITETTGMGANMVWAGVKTDLVGLTVRLAQARSHGVKAMVDVEDFLFGDFKTLQSDYATRLDQLATVVSQYPDVLAGFYLIDEPYASCALKTDADGKAECNRIQAQLTTVANYLHSAFRDVPIAVILSKNELSMDKSRIAMFDWVGFDYYYYPTDWATDIAVRIPRLAAMLSDNQRLIAVPWAYQDWRYGFNGQDACIQDINNWHKEILANPRYIAVAPFMWQGDHGTREQPWVKERTKQLAYNLLRNGGAQVFPMSVSASNVWTDEALLKHVPFLAFNRNASDAWNSGGFPTQQIAAILPGNTRVGRIALKVSQAPAGNTTHVIWGMTPNYSIKILSTISQFTQDGQSIGWTGPADDFVMIGVQTTAGPSWVAWSDIQMFAP